MMLETQCRLRSAHVLAGLRTQVYRLANVAAVRALVSGSNISATSHPNRPLGIGVAPSNSATSAAN
jgi:hypothetical protein